MLKWLRKYNTFILVVGGCLLMVAFLLQGVLNEVGRHGFLGSTVFKVGSKRVGQEEYSQSAREYGALSLIIESSRVFQGRQGMAAVGGGENVEHWYLLTHEAEKAGLVGGPKDGEDYVDELARGMAAQVAGPGQSAQIETYKTMIRLGMDMARNQAMGQARLTEDQLNQAFAKLRGAVRLQNAYIATTRYSSRRLAAESRSLADQITMDYAMIPAERELAGIPEPTEPEIKAHYDRFKDTPKGGGDFGIGYKLPPRIKLTWLELNKDLIAAAVTVDGIEVEKRFLAQYPNGQVAPGKTPESERVRIESEVRKEVADKVMKTADQVVRSEIDKSIRKLDREGDYLAIPSDWAARRPDFAQIAETVARRLNEQYKIVIPAPKVSIRDHSWIEQDQALALEGIGQSFVRRSQNTLRFTQIAFNVHELSDSPEPGFQVGIPYTDTLESGLMGSGNRYYFIILDARKESAPDSLEEVKDDVTRNVKRLAAYDKLKAREASILADAVATGLDAVARAPAGSTEIPSPVREATISKSRAIVPGDPASQALDTKEVREKIVSSFAAIDPMTDPNSLPPGSRTFSTPVDKALALCVYRAKRMLPLTVERFRSAQAGLVRQASMTELKDSLDENPFSYETMRKRLNVTGNENTEARPSKKTQAAK